MSKEPAVVRVLVVEDESLIRWSVADTLARAGHTVLEASDAQLAPATRLGTETVARVLGLRLNHPKGSDDLELLPTQPATRAEALTPDVSPRRFRTASAPIRSDRSRS